jgi:class 3 adenylate cyclase/tetratricopeptide (TPR) repeat protein
VLCQSCHSESPAGSRFCAGCGTQFPGACSSCGGSLPPEAGFCPGCGASQKPGSAAPSASSPAAPSAGENRQLTVMFCDLVGSSELAQRLGAESYHECLGRYQEACANTVGRFGGYVAQLLGDGALVYFGYPQAHENDAERAVLAALELVASPAGAAREFFRAMDVELQVRIGIHTGPVVVGEIGLGERRETLALGDTTNIAARVESRATPNTVLITEATKHLVDGLFETRDLGTPPLKGIANPIRVYAVDGSSGARSRLEVATRMSPMVGRRAELEQMVEAWQQASSGRARALMIGGEPGLGKSRIVSRLQEHIGGVEHHWLTLRCTPFTIASALHPWIELLKDYFHIDSGEPPDANLARLRDALQPLGDAADEIAERFARLIGVPLPAGSLLEGESVELARHQTLDALLMWVGALSQGRPVVLLVEDLHWGDPSTLEWIGLLIERCREERTLLLLTHRPEFEPPWNAASLERISLERLGATHARTLAKGAVVGEPLSSELIGTIVERADGVPLFLEELAKMVSESRDGESGSTLEVPATLRDLLMARLDRLGAAKSIAQIGAVIGRDFSHELLCEIAPGDESMLQASLAGLLDSGLIFCSGAPPDAVYTFKHALVQDTAYESLLRGRRSEIHKAVAVAHSEGGAEVSSSVLGHHWRGAGEWLKAADQFDSAGRQAAASAALEEALSHYREGLANAARAPEGRERQCRELSLNIMLGNALMAAKGFQYPECLEVWLRAEALAEAVDDPNELSSARNGAAVYHLTNGNLDEAERYAQRVLDLAARGDARIIGLRAHLSLASCFFYRGEGQRAHKHAERAIELYRPSDFWEVTYGSSLDQGVGSYAMSAMTLQWLGQLDDALARAEQGLALAIELASPLSVALARSTICLVCIDRGDSQRLRAETFELEKLSSELSLPLWQGFAMLANGYLEASAGNPSGIDQIFEGVAIQGEMVGQSGATMGMCLLAGAQLGVENHDEAEAIVDAGLSLGDAQEIPYYEDMLLILKAEITLSRDATANAAARQLLIRARSQARERGAKLFEVRAATDLAPLLASSGEKEAARAILSESAEGFQGEGTAVGRALREVIAGLA